MKNYFLLFLFLFLLSACTDENEENTINNNGNWSKLNFEGDGNGIYSSCSDNQNLYIGTLSNGVYKSTDFGNTWTEKNNGITNKKNCKVFYLNNNLYAVTNEYLNGGVSPLSNKIYKSNNGGDSWELVYENVNFYYASNIDAVFGSIVSFDIIDNNIYIGFGKHLLKSSNNGFSWEIVFTNPSAYFPSGVKKIIKFGSKLILLLNEFSLPNQSIFVSNDNGNSFSAVSNLNYDNYRYISITSSSDRIFIGTLWGEQINNGIFSSDISLSNWEMINPISNPTQFDLLSFGSMGFYDNTVYATCNNNSVYYSNDNGLTWFELGNKVVQNSNSMSDKNILKINNYLFVITLDEVYRYNL